MKVSNALFRTLADTPGTRAGMLSFSNKFGLLTVSHKGRPRSVEMGVDDLLTEHAALRHAVLLFERGRQADLVEFVNRGWASRQWGRMRQEFRIDSDGKIARVFVPDSLIHALWLQFAAHIESDARLVRCQQCHQWFRVGTATNRRNTAKYCSNRCRQAAYLARKKET
jgi:hypothetical protein